jgi:hypothetical protein
VKIKTSVAILSFALGLIAFTVLPVTADAAEPRPERKPALDGVFDAFRTHPLVGLADPHGVVEAGDFYATLIRDPRFASQVGNVVVEFGGSAQQAVIDRYLTGEEVPYEELRHVWLDVVGWVPGVVESMYPAFFAQVRAANLTLPPDRRTRVWLGEPAIDWGKVRTSADHSRFGAMRNEHPAQLIEREIMAKGKKALVIYGLGHFTRQPGNPFPGDRPIRARVEEKHPHAFFVIWPHMAAEPGCQAEVEKQTEGWTAGTLAAPIKGTWIEALYGRPGCFRSGRDRAAMVDALLYLGDPAQLRMSPADPRTYLDTTYFQELSRRNLIIVGDPLDWATFAQQAK